MRKNLSLPKIHSMFTSLAREAWEFWGHSEDIPKFRVIGEYRSLFGGTFEWFPGAVPSGTLASTYFNPDDHSEVKEIVLNKFHVPYMYEDEIIVALLHELAHAHVGLAAQHGPIWARAAEEIGSDPKPELVTRSLYHGEIPWYTEQERIAICNNRPEPTLGFLKETA